MHFESENSVPGSGGKLNKSTTAPSPGSRSILNESPKANLLTYNATVGNTSSPSSSSDFDHVFRLRSISDIHVRHADALGSTPATIFDTNGFDALDNSSSPIMEPTNINAFESSPATATTKVTTTTATAEKEDDSHRATEEEYSYTGIGASITQTEEGETKEQEDSMEFPVEAAEAGSPLVAQETDDERIARELAESERLAYAMMQEEAANAYNMQMEFMRANADVLSQEDFAALTAVVGEGMRPQSSRQQQRTINTNNTDIQIDNNANR